MPQRRRAIKRPSDQTAPLLGRADEAGEQGVRLEGPALQLRVELDAHEPRMVRPLADLRKLSVGREAGEPQPGGFDALAVSDVDLVAVSVVLRDGVAVVDRR